MDSADERKMIRDLVTGANAQKINMMINDEEVEKIDEALSDNDIEDEAIESSVEQSQKVDQNTIDNDFREKVLTFIRCDDLIRKKTKEIKELKDKREPCKEFILQYLVKKDSPYVNVKDGKLIKNQSNTKGTLNADIIRESISEGIKDQKLIADSAQADTVAAKIMHIMETKRSDNKIVKINLKRTFIRPKKDGDKKKSDKEEKNNNNKSDNLEELKESAKNNTKHKK